MTIDVKVGDTFGRLTVIDIEEPNGRGRRYVRCTCECGAITRARKDSLPKRVSCGCTGSVTHGDTNTRLYRIWTNIKTRTSSQDPRYYRYAGRGIALCDEWQDFMAFRDWALGAGYTDPLTIDRIDNDGNYEPSNCRWITKSENSRKARRENPRGAHRK